MTEGLIQSLDDPSIEVQIAAIRALGRLPLSARPPSDTPVGTPEYEAEQALWARFWDTSNQEAMKALIDQLDNPDPKVRLEVLRSLQGFAFALSKRPGAAPESPERSRLIHQAIEALAGLRSSPSAEERMAAAKALGGFVQQSGEAEPEAIKALAGLLKDDEAEVRTSAASALASSGPAASQVLAALIEAMRQAASPDELTAFTSSAIQIDPDDRRAVHLLLTMLSDEDRGDIAADLLEFNTWRLSERPVDLSPLVPMLTGDDPVVFHRAVRVLDQFARDRWQAVEPIIPTLSTMVQSDRPEIRAPAVETLGTLGDARQQIEPTDDSEIPRRADEPAPLSALITKALPALEELLHRQRDTTPLDALFTAEAILRIDADHPEATETLIDALRAEEPDLRTVASDLVQSLATGWDPMLMRSSPSNTALAQKVRDRLPEEQAQDLLEPAFALPEPEAPMDLDAAIQAFHQAESPENRMAALEAMGSAFLEPDELRRAIDVISSALDDPEDAVREQATQLLARRFQKPMLGEQTISELKRRVLQDESLPVRIAAVRALQYGTPGPEHYVPTLIEALNAPRNQAAEFRATAVSALTDAAAQGSIEAVDALLPFLDEKDIPGHYEDDRSVFLRSVAPPTIAALTERLRADDPETRRRAALALSALVPWSPEAQEALVQTMLSDPDAQVRKQAALALGRLAYPSRHFAQYKNVQYAPTRQFLRFPWPPPRTPHSEELKLVHREVVEPTIEEVYHQIRGALQTLGYPSRTYVIDGSHVVVVTDIERIDEMGRSMDNDRWGDGMPPVNWWSPTAIARRFFSMPVGHFRMFVFVLTPDDLLQLAPTELPAALAEQLFLEGSSLLPPMIGDRRWDKHGYRSVVNIYRYRKEQGRRTLAVSNDSLNWMDHFQRSKLSEHLRPLTPAGGGGP